MSEPLDPHDEIDRELVRKRLAKRDRQAGARQGDWVRLPDGELRQLTSDGITRFTNWKDKVGRPGFSTASPLCSSSFYLQDNGRLSFSGGNDFPVISDKHALIDTGQTKPATFWIFHHDELAAGGGRHFEAPCRVFQLVEAATS